MGIPFREYAIQILGELPETSIWLYDLFTVLTVVGVLFIILLPIACIVRRAR